MAILGISGLVNAASSSPWENYLLAPVALVLAGLCSVVAHNAPGRTARQSDDSRKAADAGTAAT